MFLETFIMSLVMSVILTLTMKHVPLFVKRLFYYCPAFVTAAAIHFGYGGWLGGVTGHLLGALLSVPMYFILKYYLQPEFKVQLAEAWETNWFNLYLWTPVKSRSTVFVNYFRRMKAVNVSA